MTTYQKSLPTEKAVSIVTFPPPTHEKESTKNKTSSLAVEENDNAALETGKASGDNHSRDAGHVSLCVRISVYSVLIFNAILMAAIIIILGILVKVMKMRAALISWFIIESAFRLSAIFITARKSSASYAITHSLGIFLGKEYYITLVNSLWPYSDPFDAIVNRPGIRIDLVWIKQGFCYILYSLLAGITLWVVTWRESSHSKDYKMWLATAGLVASLINIVNYFIGIAFATSKRVVGGRS
ncbi:754_t:CDS:2 [Paraglomus brasilianum]|uniref:754_t:CDS:1 n=1 Tax=Paraglomus brasilianum TaxID=144538 RepID=A0A9N9GFB7_9GLOM|nr:754_t:CDS:2 [Paraglomus brasilianum]